jgi:hypothetical protein
VSEELKVADTTVVEDPKDVTPEAEVVVEVSPVEQQAMEQGWVPLEDWKASGRSEAEWRPAKEFVERGEIFKTLHTTKRELKQTQATLDALARHHQYVFEKAHQQALRDLRAEKRLAMRESDMERLEEIETEIEQLNDKHVQEKTAMLREQAVARTAATPAPEFQTFVNRNPWYIADKQLRDEADAIGFVHLNNGGTTETLLAHVEKEIKKKFPEKFGVKRSAPNAVAGVNRTGKAPARESFELTQSQREVMNRFVEKGIMTAEQYIKELKKAGN